MNSEKNEGNHVDDSKINEIFEKARSKEPGFSLSGSLHEINNFNLMDPSIRLLISSLCFAMLVVIYIFGEFVIGAELRITLSRLFYGGFWTSVSVGLTAGFISSLWELALIKKETAFLLNFAATENKKRLYSFELQKKNFALNLWIGLIIASLPVFAIKYEFALFPMIFSLGIPMVLFNGEIGKFNEKLKDFKNNSSGPSSVPVSSFAPALSSEGSPGTSSGVSHGFGFWDAFLYFSLLMAVLSVIYCLNNLSQRPDTLLERSVINSSFTEPGNIRLHETQAPDALELASISAAAIMASVVLSFVLTMLASISAGLFKRGNLTDKKIRSIAFF